MDLLGEAVHIVCSERDPTFHRINYEIHGNRDAILHAHIWLRYNWEPDQHRRSPVGLYPPETWAAPDSQLGPQHDRLRNQLTLQIDRLADPAAR